MVTLKRVYEPPTLGDGLRVLVERRWPWRLDKATAAIDRWEKELAPSIDLHRWFGGRRARWVEFRSEGQAHYVHRRGRVTDREPPAVGGDPVAIRYRTPEVVPFHGK